MKIIHEEKDYLVINKPAGLIVHGGNGITEKTLSDFLLEKYPEIKEVGDDPQRPGIVHRLDKDASGLMIVAKTQEAFNYLKKQFQDREVKKEYIALTCGKIAKDFDTIDFPIKRASSGHKMAAIPRAKNIEVEDMENANNRSLGNVKGLAQSRDAITEFEVIQKLINYTLLKVTIKTGRTHQIRVHFYAYGHPLLGDPLYKNKESVLKSKKTKINRIFLMAQKIGFKDLEGNWQEFEVELDDELKELLQKLK